MDYIERAKQLVADRFNTKVEKTDQFRITTDDVYVVWFVKSLGTWKALVSTTIPDGMYYEVTCNLGEGVTYVDSYKKWDHVEIIDTEGGI